MEKRLLSNSKAIELIGNPSNKVIIDRLVKQESKLRVYTEPMGEEEITKEEGYNSFKTNLRKSLSVKRFTKLMKFQTYPIESTSVSSSILTELYKVFDSSNSFFDIETNTPELTEKAFELVAEMDLGKWIKKKGTDVMRSKANAIVLIDFDSEKGGEPILKLIDIDSVIDYGLKNKDGELDYLITKIGSVKLQDETTAKVVGVYDNVSYRIYIQNDENYSLLIENNHVLGECPARFFWSQSVTESNINYRQTPLVPVLGAFEKWERFNLFKFYADHYVPFPVVEMISASCPNQRCKGGMIEHEHTLVVDGVNTIESSFVKCTTCNEFDLIGPGSYTAHNPPSDKTEFDPYGKFRFISPEVEGNKYVNYDILQKQKDWIFSTVVGQGQLNQNQSVNELQVLGSFESKQQVLIDIKNNFDKIYKWIAESSIKLIYGSSTDVTVTANFGTQFYLYQPSDIMTEFEKAKTDGMPESILTNLYFTYIQTKYKENPIEIMKLKMLKELEPVPFSTYDEAVIRRNNGIISTEDLAVKGNFTNFIARFEREQGSIVYFGVDLPMNIRIDRITEVIYSYIKIEKVDGTENDGAEQTR